MLKKIGISVLLMALTGCSTSPVTEKPDYAELMKANESIKADIPEYVQYTVKGLVSVECKQDKCTMSETDFRQNQHDKKQLLALHKLNHQENVARVNAYNSLVDAYTFEQMAGNKYLESAERWEAAYDKERTISGEMKWVERGLFIMGVWVFGNL